MGTLAARHRRARLAKKLRVPKVHELRYQHALAGAMRTLHTAALDWLKPQLDTLIHAKRDGARFDAILADEFERKVRDLVPALARSVAPAFSQLATAAAKNNARVMRSMGVDIRGDLGATFEQIQEYNISLMARAADDFASDVAGVLRDPDSWGLTVESLAQKIQGRADVSESRATLIARDQTSKTNGRINMIRQTHAGIDRFEWSTALDERVRETHADNEGQIFAWNSPPIETGLPSDDVNCRCIGIPILSDEGDDEE